VGEGLLQRLLGSVFSGAGGEGIGGENQLGEAFFEVAQRQEGQVRMLQTRIDTLEGRLRLAGDAQQARSRGLLERTLFRSTRSVFLCWKRRMLREHGWKLMRWRVERRWEAEGRPRAFFRWLAVTETLKRERWQRIAEMAQWEAKYSRPAPS
jgi:hypothetical protein